MITVGRLRGPLDPQWSTWFEGLSVAETVGVAETVDGDATLCGPLTDQAALHGVLARIRDLGLELLAVTSETDQYTDAAPEG